MRFTRWDQSATTEQTNEILLDLASWHLGQIQSDRVRHILSYWVYTEGYADLCRFEPDYTELSVGDALHVRQVLGFYSKRSDLDIGVDRTAVALATFEESEAACREVNIKFRNRANGKLDSFSPLVEEVMSISSKTIREILGRVPPLGQLKPHFGPGATTQVKKKNASARRKLAQRLSCSGEFLLLAPEALEELQGWLPYQEGLRTVSDHQKYLIARDEGWFDTSVLTVFPRKPDTALVELEIHPGKLDFVPKNAKTDRGIMVEPMLNTMFQLAVGQYIAARLKRRGQDIHDQTRNQSLAKVGSVTGLLATLDLRAASDRIATLLVADQLPGEWFDLLSKLRTGTVRSPYFEGPRRLEKFSSMGNGFTFPLQTLLFYALISACCEVCGVSTEDVSVYGDDIICPTSVVPLAFDVLSENGMEVNRSKSFWTGSFRESCGADYLSGINIRPFYQKEEMTGESLFCLHNFYVRNKMDEPARIALGRIDETLRIWGPDGYGDGHLVGDHQRMAFKRSHGWGGYTFDTYIWGAKRDFQVLPGDLVLPGYSAYVRETELPPVAPKEVFDKLRPIAVVNGLSGKHRTGGGLYRKGMDYPSVLASNGATYRVDQSSFGVSTPGKTACKRIKIYTVA